MTLAEPNPRVMHVITGLDMGGAEMQLVQLVSARAARGGRDVIVPLVPGGALQGRLEQAGVAVHALGMTRGSASPAGLIRLIALIRRLRPDIVQGWMYHANLLSALALRFSGRRSLTPLIWGIRCSDMDLASYGAGLRRVVRLGARLSRMPDAITVNANAAIEVHRRLGYRPRRFEVIDNGIDTARYRPDEAARAEVRQELGISADTPVLAHVSRVDPMKDHETFLRALDQLHGIEALLIGLGTERLSLHNGCRALGRRDDVPRLLTACDLIVSSSAFGEGFSNALAEGMAAGLPAVTTDVGDSARIVGETGRVVPPRDAGALAAAIRDLISEPAEARSERRQAARLRIEHQFSVARSVEAYAALYASLV